eukprot:s1823_g13.t1
MAAQVTIGGLTWVLSTVFDQLPVNKQEGTEYMKLQVSLPSGRSVVLSLLCKATILDLKMAAQPLLGQRFLRFAAADGRLLQRCESLELVLKDGDSVAAVAQRPEVAATCRGFAVWCTGSDRIVTWGGPTPTVFSWPFNVQQVCGKESGFAAVLVTGQLISWGYPGRSHDREVKRLNLKATQKATQIHATNFAFAATLADGHVVTWGEPDYGGRCVAVQDQLKNVEQIHATDRAFAAILKDGRVVTWGARDYGGDSTRVQDQLRRVQTISSTAWAFAAILADRSVVTWGWPFFGGDSAAVQDQLRNVQQIHGTETAFAAILADTTVVTWGNPTCGGDSTRVRNQLRNVKQVSATGSAFAAVLADGAVVTWGDATSGGNSESVQPELRRVQHVSATAGAFAAILADGSVVTWGYADSGGDSSPVREQLKDVQQIHGTQAAFAAILANGTVITWGHPAGPRDELRGEVESTAWKKILARSGAGLPDGYLDFWEAVHGEKLAPEAKVKARLFFQSWSIYHRRVCKWFDTYVVPFLEAFVETIGPDEPRCQGH